MQSYLNSEILFHALIEDNPEFKLNVPEIETFFREVPGLTFDGHILVFYWTVSLVYLVH